MLRLLAALYLLTITAASSADWIIDKRLTQIFTEAGVSGTFILHNVSKNQYHVHNAQRAKERYLPASTFKIANSLIGLTTGAVSSVDEVLPYGGGPQFLKAWEKDMGLRQALPISNVPIYQELARRIGLQRMQTGIQTLGYGNQQIGTSVDTFWLKGPLKISALEQVDFLAKLAQGTLTGIPPQHQADVRAITRLETNQDCALYAKTGWATATDPELGWWIGWCVKNNHIYTFALNMDMRSSADGDLRIELGKKALRLFDLLLASTQPAP